MNKKKITAMFTALTITAGAFFMPTVEAKMNTVEKIALGAAAVYFVSQYLAKMDNNQKGLIGEVQGKTGVDKDPEDNERVQGIYQSFRNTGYLTRDYEVYVCPDEELNAFMSFGGILCVNKGTLNLLDDQELAAVMAHEITHGEERHNLKGTKKSVGLSLATSLYLSDNASYAQQVLGNIITYNISNGIFSKDEEKEADKEGFEYLVTAGYNPGAGAAAMQVIYNNYGESAPTGIKSIIMAGDHPKTSDRINKNNKWMTEYSGKHVTVNKDGYIVINGDKIFKAEKYGRYEAKERNWLTAGKLAKLYHEGNVKDAVNNNGTIMIDKTSIYTTSANENPDQIVKTMNTAIAKDRGTKVEENYEIVKRAKEYNEKLAKQNAEKTSAENNAPEAE